MFCRILQKIHQMFTAFAMEYEKRTRSFLTFLLPRLLRLPATLERPDILIGLQIFQAEALLLLSSAEMRRQDIFPRPGAFSLFCFCRSEAVRGLSPLPLSGYRSGVLFLLFLTQRPAASIVFRTPCLIIKFVLEEIIDMVKRLRAVDEEII